MGCIFERMCMQHIEWLSSQDQLPFDIMELGRWWRNNPVLKEQEEIDILASIRQGEKRCWVSVNTTMESSTWMLSIRCSSGRLFPQFVDEYFIFYPKTVFSESVYFYAQTHKEMRLVTLEETYDWN